MRKIAFILGALALGSLAPLTMAQSPGGPARGAVFERLKAADTNGDGFISRTEAAALPRIAEHFDEIDANKDGLVSFQELRAFHRKARGAMRFKRMDTDGDGKVSRAEAMAAAAAAFDRADADKDGFLTPEEIKAAHRARRGPPQ